MPTSKRERQRQGRQARQEAVRAAQKTRRRKRSMVAGGLVVMLIFGLAALLNSGGDDEETEVTSGTSTTVAPATPAAPACPSADGSSPKTQTFPAAPPMCIDPAKTYTAEVVTTKGPFTITFDAKAAPRTVNNFVFLARYHYYDGVGFHRVIPGFVVQGGDPQGTGSGGPGYSFEDELPQAGQYKVGSVAMANSGANTNGSQFYVITGAQGVALPPQYSLFGQVTSGMETVKVIEALGSPDGKPTESVTMQSVTIKES